MSHTKTYLLLLTCWTVFGCANTGALPPLQTVPRVEVERYMGLWYEICRYPNRFQKNCAATTARYTLRDDGDVDVLNTCFLGGIEGKKKEASGKAWVVDKGSNAKLKVSFFWPFSGDYWIIDLGKDYEYAVVGNPTRKYFWVLSRAPKLEPTTLDGILERAESQGYQRSKLIWTKHN